MEHIARIEPGDLISTSGYVNICGSLADQYYTVSEYYRWRDEMIADYWCPDCVAGLTPLDELGNTEL